MTEYGEESVRSTAPLRVRYGYHILIFRLKYGPQDLGGALWLFDLMTLVSKYISIRIFFLIAITSLFEYLTIFKLKSHIWTCPLIVSR